MSNDCVQVRAFELRSVFCSRADWIQTCCRSVICHELWSHMTAPIWSRINASFSSDWVWHTKSCLKMYLHNLIPFVCRQALPALLDILGVLRLNLIYYMTSAIRNRRIYNFLSLTTSWESSFMSVFELWFTKLCSQLLSAGLQAWVPVKIQLQYHHYGCRTTRLWIFTNKTFVGENCQTHILTLSQRRRGLWLLFALLRGTKGTKECHNMGSVKAGSRLKKQQYRFTQLS